MLKFFFYSVKWKNMESLREAKFKAIHRVVGVGKVKFLGHCWSWFIDRLVSLSSLQTSEADYNDVTGSDNRTS